MHCFMLEKEQSRLDVRKYYLSKITVNECNKLSGDCLHSSNINMIKSIIDNYFVRVTLRLIHVYSR